eukprot:gene5178-3725_t
MLPSPGTVHSSLSTDDQCITKFEKEHVHNTYDAIAKHFSASRYKEWPQVAQFLQQQPPYALIADAGCGNGKYFECAQYQHTGEDMKVEEKKKRRPKRVRGANGQLVFEKAWASHSKPARRFVVGFDRCRALLELALNSEMEQKNGASNGPESRSYGTLETPADPAPRDNYNPAQAQIRPPRGADVLCCDVQCCPFRNGSFDAAVCIAVLHHYATPARRLDAVRRLIRLVRPDGGRVLIYVWAIEQPRKAAYEVNETSGDALIPWQMNQKFDDEQKVYQRYYHLFRKGELETLCLQALKAEGTAGKVEKSYYDKENWCSSSVHIAQPILPNSPKVERCRIFLHSTTKAEWANKLSRMSAILVKRKIIESHFDPRNADPHVFYRLLSVP